MLQYLAGTEMGAIKLRRFIQQIRSEVRGKGKRQSQIRGQARAEIA